MNSAKQCLLDRTEPAALVNSRRLWLFAQDQHKTKPVSTLARIGKGIMSPQTGGGKSRFPFWVQKFYHTLADGFTRVYEHHRLNLVGY